MSDIDQLFSQEALNSLSKVEQAFKDIVTTIDGLVTKSNSLDQLITALGKSGASQAQVNQAVKEAITITNQLNKAEQDRQNAVVQLGLNLKDYNAMMKAKADADNEELGTLARLTAANKALTLERKGVIDATGAGKQKVQELNAEIDKNNAVIKSNVDNLSKQKIGIGAYADGIKGAIVGMVSAGAVVGLLMAALGKLKDAFLDTTAGMNLMTKSGEVMSQLWYNLITQGKSLQDSLGSAIKIGDELNQLRVESRTNLVKEADSQYQYNKLYFEAVDKTKTHEERIELLNKAFAVHNSMIDNNITLTKKNLDIVEEQLQGRENSTKLLNQEAELEAKLFNLESQRFSETKRLESQLTSMEEQDQQAKEKRVDELVAMMKQGLKEQEDDRQKAEDAYMKDEDQWFEVAKKEAQKEAAEKKKDIEDTWNFEVEIGKKAFEENQKQAKKEFDEIHKNDKQKIDDEKKTNTEILKLKQELTDQSMQLVSELINAQYTKQLDALDKQYNADIAAAGDNATKKAQIDAAYNAKKAQLQTKEAKAEKAEAIFQVVVNTAATIMKTMAQTGFIAGTPLIPLIIAEGAMQAAMIAAKPIPQYFLGTPFAKGGPAIVGERGHELIVEPSGKVSLTGSSAEIVDIKRGSKIIPGEETKRIIAAATASKINNSDAIQESRHKELIKTIKNKREIIIGTRTGKSITEREGNTYKEYFAKYLK